MEEYKKQEKLIDTIFLKNGLVLKIFDRSRPVAGDRWLVVLWVFIEIPVRPDYFEVDGSESVSIDAVRNALGDKVTYTYEKKRNFIGRDEKDGVLEGLKDRLLQTTMPYLSSTKFPRNIILSQYREVEKRRSLFDAD